MLRRIYFAIVAVMLLTAGQAAHAQTVNGLIITINGDLWSYDPTTGERNQLTEWGYNGQPHISPNTTQVAYLSQSEESVENPDYIYAGTPPGNIWVLNKSDGSFTRIADQSGSGDILRSQPEWSPDGSRLAWSELTIQPQDGGMSSARLVIYDMRTGQTSVLSNNYDLGFQDGGIYMPPVKWGGGGIMRVLYTAVESGEGLPFAQILEIYNPDTGAMTSFTLGRAAPMGDSSSDTVLEHLWADENGQSRIVLFQRKSGWSTLNPNTGVLSPLPTVPFRSVVRGVSAIKLTPIFEEQPNNNGYRWNWQADVRYDGGQPGYSTYIGYSASNLGEYALPVLSGSYQLAWMAYQDRTAITYLWQDGAAQNPQTIFSADLTAGQGIGPAGVAWLPTQWYIDRTGTPVPPTPTQPPLPAGQCPPPHPTDFEAGELVTVSPGPPNNWREQPSTGARVLGVFPAGTMLTILEGPVCADGFNWYYVQFTEGRGWTAGGDGTEYWLQPAG